jgi:hypothetical protein
LYISDYLYNSASHHWTFDKEIGGSLFDRNGFKQGTFYGPQYTTASQGNTEGFNSIATQFDGTSNWADLGDFKGSCVCDTDLCDDGLSGKLTK